MSWQYERLANAKDKLREAIDCLHEFVNDRDITDYRDDYRRRLASALSKMVDARIDLEADE